MLQYSLGQKISLNLTLVNNDSSPEANANVSYKIFNESNTLEVSGSNLAFNNQLGSYIDVIDPSTDWTSQSEGIYYVLWEISDTVEEFPEQIVEELYINLYDNKLDTIKGLVHENMSIDNAVYDKWDNMKSARLRIYSDSDSVGTDSNIIGEYEIYAETTNVGKFSHWLQKKVE